MLYLCILYTFILLVKSESLKFANLFYHLPLTIDNLSIQGCKRSHPFLEGAERRPHCTQVRFFGLWKTFQTILSNCQIHFKDFRHYWCRPNLHNFKRQKNETKRWLRQWGTFCSALLSASQWRTQTRRREGKSKTKTKTTMQKYSSDLFIMSWWRCDYWLCWWCFVAQGNGSRFGFSPSAANVHNLWKDQSQGRLIPPFHFSLLTNIFQMVNS